MLVPRYCAVAPAGRVPLLVTGALPPGSGAQPTPSTQLAGEGEGEGEGEGDGEGEVRPVRTAPLVQVLMTLQLGWE